MCWDYTILDKDWVQSQNFKFDHFASYRKPYDKLVQDAIDPKYIIPYYIDNLGGDATLYNELIIDVDFLKLLTSYMRLKSLEEKLVLVLNTLRTKFNKEFYDEGCILTILSTTVSRLNIMMLYKIHDINLDIYEWMPLCNFIHTLETLEHKMPYICSISSKSLTKHLDRWTNFIKEINMINSAAAPNRIGYKNM
uniref:Uncharacterized protein n=1 Tax=viral metagenome TaxID=1070528 RepID=A0A6C0J8I8_9ZZZZ